MEPDDIETSDPWDFENFPQGRDVRRAQAEDPQRDSRHPYGYYQPQQFPYSAPPRPKDLREYLNDPAGNVLVFTRGQDSPPVRLAQHIFSSIPLWKQQLCDTDRQAHLQSVHTLPRGVEYVLDLTPSGDAVVEKQLACPPEIVTWRCQSEGNHEVVWLEEDDGGEADVLLHDYVTKAGGEELINFRRTWRQDLNLPDVQEKPKAVPKLSAGERKRNLEEIEQARARRMKPRDETYGMSEELQQEISVSPRVMRNRKQRDAYKKFGQTEGHCISYPGDLSASKVDNCGLTRNTATTEFEKFHRDFLTKPTGELKVAATNDVLSRQQKDTRRHFAAPRMRLGAKYVSQQRQRSSSSQPLASAAASKSPKSPQPPRQDPASYTPARHSGALLRILLLLTDGDPHLYSAPMFWTLYRLSLHLSCPCLVVTSITNWILSSNPLFLELYTPLCVSIATTLRSTRLFRACFELLVARRMCPYPLHPTDEADLRVVRLAFSVSQAAQKHHERHMSLWNDLQKGSWLREISWQPTPRVLWGCPYLGPYSMEAYAAFCASVERRAALDTIARKLEKQLSSMVKIKPQIVAELKARRHRLVDRDQWINWCHEAWEVSNDKSSCSKGRHPRPHGEYREWWGCWWGAANREPIKDHILNEHTGIGKEHLPDIQAAFLKAVAGKVRWGRWFDGGLVADLTDEEWACMPHWARGLPDIPEPFTPAETSIPQARNALASLRRPPRGFQHYKNLEMTPLEYDGDEVVMEVDRDHVIEPRQPPLRSAAMTGCAADYGVDHGIGTEEDARVLYDVLTAVFLEHSTLRREWKHRQHCWENGWDPATPMPPPVWAPWAWEEVICVDGEVSPEWTAVMGPVVGAGLGAGVLWGAGL